MSPAGPKHKLWITIVVLFVCFPDVRLCIFGDNISTDDVGFLLLIKGRSMLFMVRSIFVHHGTEF